MKITYAYIINPWPGIEMFKVVPFMRIRPHGRRIIYENIWALPDEDAKSKTVSTIELKAIANDMGRQIVFKTENEFAGENIISPIYSSESKEDFNEAQKRRLKTV